MDIVYKHIDDIRQYVNNPRLNEGAVDAVAASISEFGFKVPIIIDKDGEIIAGHTRHKAATQLGIEFVPCIVADDLSEQQIRAFRIADNKVSEHSMWDNELLNIELGEISEIDMQLFGDYGTLECAHDIADIDETGDKLAVAEHSISIDRTRITITDEEYNSITDKLDEYIDENGVSFGFVRWLLDGC